MSYGQNLLILQYSACSSTVAGVNWIKCCVDILREYQKQNVKCSQSSTIFKFGAGEEMGLFQKVTIPF